MKGTIFDIRRFSVHDGPGIRTTVFFKGCPMGCIWCHNPESRKSNIEEVISEHRIGGKVFPCNEMIGKEMTVSEIIDEVKRDFIFYEESGGGVTISGGEPLYQFNFLKDLLKELGRNNFHTALDTTGYTEENLPEEICGDVDLFLYDIKHMDNDEHIKYTGLPNAGILKNLELLIKLKKKIILRIPVIPGINDTRANFDAIKNLIMKYPGTLNEVHFLPYHNIAENKYRKVGLNNVMKGIPSLSKKDLLPLKNEFETLGIKVKIGG
jgi:pyruvate formate lyase activating enzyme